MSKPKILIVDDEKMTRDAMARILGGEYDCLTAADPELALAELDRTPDVALILTDYKMPVMNGVEFIRAAKAKFPTIGAILITAFGEIELAVEAMKDGADDFLTKPITDFAQLRTRIERVLKVGALERKVADLESKLDAQSGLNALTGSSPAMERVYQLVRRIAPTPATVLIEGESGTGKELVAKALHDLSSRKDKSFVAVECSAFSGDLLKSELFGYVAGTFTGGLKEGKKGCIESAAGGTLFLDEIGEIDMPTQIALLRTLQTKSVRRLGASEETPVDFRLVAATNKNLKEMVAEGKFREDLFFRLNVIPIDLPPLRERPGDIALLASRFLKEFAKEYASGVRGFEQDALSALERYPWPGNVRELRNVIERMVVLATGEKLTKADLPAEICRSGEDAASPVKAAATAGDAESLPLRPPTAALPTGDAYPPKNSVLRAAEGRASSPLRPPATTLADAEKQQILAALEATGGNKSKAAEILGISRRTLHRKLNEWKSQD